MLELNKKNIIKVFKENGIRAKVNEGKDGCGLMFSLEGEKYNNQYVYGNDFEDLMDKFYSKYGHLGEAGELLDTIDYKYTHNLDYMRSFVDVFRYEKELSKTFTKIYEDLMVEGD